VKIDWSQPGVPVSAAAHVALLVASLVALSSTQPFADAQESVPVDIITASEFNAMTKGEKTAKAVEPQPKPRVDKVAEAEQLKPTQGADPTDVPTPPARAPDISDATSPPLPPVRPPDPPKPPEKTEPQKPVETQKPEPPKEAEIPKPPEKPQPPKPPVKPPEPPKETADKPKPQPLDTAKLAQLLEQKKTEPQPPKPPARIKAPTPDFSKTQSEIEKLLVSKEKPQSAGSTGRELQRVASLGTQAGDAPKMSPSMRGQLIALLRDQFSACFTAPPGVEPQPGAMPMIHIEFNGPDGTLSGRPALRNPSSDPGTRALSEAAVRAIARCAPYKIPAQFAPFFDDWRETIFQIDLKNLTG
jgi:colicin import membrane protein